MDVSIGKRWEEFVAGLVAEGRYPSSSDVVRDGLRLIRKREQKLQDLRQRLNDAIAEEGEVGPDELAAILDADILELSAEKTAP